jgi:translation initiation factor 2B subunit (eIF-2B alpha/beta/delta family)
MHPAIAQLASDRTSGATALVLRGIGILQRVASERGTLVGAARDLCRAQPSMAGMHTAAAIAISAPDPHDALATLAVRVGRSAGAIARLGAPVLALRRHADALRVATCSASAAVEATLLAVAGRTDLDVACSESRPAREGVELAARLAAAGVRTELYSDAGIAFAIPHRDALIVGADALGESGFINKAGTSALIALAFSVGVPVMVLAGRDKILPESIYRSLPLREGESRELDIAPGAYRVRNPYFERISWDWVAAVVTDSAEMHPAQVVAASLWSEDVLGKYMSVMR